MKELKTKLQDSGTRLKGCEWYWTWVPYSTHGAVYDPYGGCKFIWNFVVSAPILKHSTTDLKDAGGVFFLHSYRGIGKTFIWRILFSTLRSRGEIALNVASSGITTLLIPGGRTAHSRFSIPLSVNEDSTCNIKQKSDVVELIAKARLIIWDRAPIVHKHCFEALDKTLREMC